MKHPLLYIKSYINNLYEREFPTPKTFITHHYSVLFINMSLKIKGSDYIYTKIDSTYRRVYLQLIYHKVLY
jgi:hypothetical protein